MKILSKYILKETAFPFFLSLGVISFMLIMNKVLTLVDLVLKHGVGLDVVLRLVAYLLPSTFAITIPMSLLMGAMLALGRLSADMELVAMKAGGVSLSSLLRPLLILGLVFSVGMMAFNEIALPRANQGYKSLFYDIISKKSSAAIQVNTYVSDFENLIIRVGGKAPEGNDLSDITVIKLNSDKEPLQWIQADHGRLVSDDSNHHFYMQLNDGMVQFLGEEGQDHLTTLFFKSSTVDLDLGGSLKAVQGEDKQPQEMNISEIRKSLEAMPLGDHRRFHFGVEMHKKIAIPFACLSFLVIGFPLGLLVRKGGRMLSFVFAIGLIFVYYLFLSMGQTFGDDGKLEPWLSMWLANLSLAAIGLPLTWAALREKRFWLANLR
jgi:lipopolysaccharide export system permease protein